jgi:hypothetical protein
MSENKYVAAIKYSADRIDTGVMLASDLETIQIVRMNTSMIRADADALAAQLAEERARADTLSAKADALEQRVRHLECTPRISYSSGTRPGGDLAGTEAEAERSQMERFLTYHEHIEEFREVQRNPSLWMHRYINGDLPDTEGTHHE